MHRRIIVTYIHLQNCGAQTIQEGIFGNIYGTTFPINRNIVIPEVLWWLYILRRTDEDLSSNLGRITAFPKFYVVFVHQ